MLISYTYQYRREEERYSRKISIEEIEKNDFNLNISRYVSTAKPEEQIDLSVINQSLIEIEKEIVNSTKEHNKYLKELGLPPLP